MCGERGACDTRTEKPEPTRGKRGDKSGLRPGRPGPTDLTNLRPETWPAFPDARTSPCFALCCWLTSTVRSIIRADEWDLTMIISLFHVCQKEQTPKMASVWPSTTRTSVITLLKANTLSIHLFYSYGTIWKTHSLSPLEIYCPGIYRDIPSRSL